MYTCSTMWIFHYIVGICAIWRIAYGLFFLHVLFKWKKNMIKYLLWPINLSSYLEQKKKQVVKISEKWMDVYFMNISPNRTDIFLQSSVDIFINNSLNTQLIIVGIKSFCLYFLRSNDFHKDRMVVLCHMLYSITTTCKLF